MFNSANYRPLERHGMSKDPTYRIWAGMIQRCHNPKCNGFPRYGAKGIKVCKRWRESFSAFLEAMGSRPSPSHTLDRFPDRDGDYKPGNVRWATPLQQARNKKAYLSREVFAGSSSAPRTKLIAVRVRDDERRWIEGEAKKRKTSVADLLRLALAALKDEAETLPPSTETKK